MTNQNIYIVEDMGVTRATIISVLRRAGYHVAGSSASAEKAWDEISQKEIQLVILDINLKGTKDGLWLAKKIRASLHCAIIFLTAYGSRNILDKIHDTEPDGYIMKPFNNPTLLSSIRVSLRNFQNQNQTIAEEQAVFVKTREGMVKIYSTEVIYLKSKKNYVYLYTDNKAYEVRGKLTTLLKILDFENIYRTHRRYAVNANKIVSFDKNSLRIASTIELPISQSFQTEELIDFIESNSTSS